MQVRFWGTRGSIAKPGSGTVRYGGNTSCVEVRSASGTLVILDCGTGLQNLGEALMKDSAGPIIGHILITHTHWDHIQGIPFFGPFFKPGNEWDIYAPRGLNQSLKNVLAGQMEYTYFPITLESFVSTIRYHDILEGVFEVSDIKIRSQYLNHPALTLGYRLEVDGAAVVYACDHEPYSRQFGAGVAGISEQDRHHIDFLGNADLVIHDAQYTAEEYPSKVGWGHSSIERVVDMCRLANAKRLAFTHHDPLRHDDSITEIERAASGYAAASNASLDVFAAQEGTSIEIAYSDRVSSSTDNSAFSAVTPIIPALLDHDVLLGSVDSVLVNLISEICETEDARIVVAENAKEVLQVAAAKQPSLIILDEQLEEGFCLDVAQRFRTIGSAYSAEATIIAIADDENELTSAAEFVDDILLKPFSTEYARTRVRAWLLRNTCRWIRSPLPHDEDSRLESLHRLNILDTEPEDRFDRYTRLAANLFNVPIALVSLVDRDRQWFKSRHGLAVDETTREVSFCAHALHEENMLVVNDALADPRFADNPLVTNDPRVRFYAGYPLALPDNSRVGTFCVIDVRPRELNEQQIGMLRDLGQMVELELSTL
ncbi:MBL fold metallo-hydrolase [Ruegeria arenilitoris]|uniref:MBL fold metallo-hydrolase n=1 Tax=Ruegeria arenilitoris TaxID=1173585 RepID=UPI001C2C4701|nr:MBL fold metallo-hydrolase [Ruegeria arenilitoris]